MKKLLSVLLLFLVAACVKNDLIDYSSYYFSNDIFETQGGVVLDASLVEINLDKSGKYVISLEDEFTSKVVTKEQFTGNKGANVLYVFTKIVPKGSYYLTLIDKNGNQVQKTKISI